MTSLAAGFGRIGTSDFRMDKIEPSPLRGEGRERVFDE